VEVIAMAMRHQDQLDRIEGSPGTFERCARGIGGEGVAGLVLSEERVDQDLFIA
jgi:hypothetical protein